MQIIFINQCHLSSRTLLCTKRSEPNATQSEGASLKCAASPPAAMNAEYFMDVLPLQCWVKWQVPFAKGIEERRVVFPTNSTHYSTMQEDDKVVGLLPRSEGPVYKSLSSPKRVKGKEGRVTSAHCIGENFLAVALIVRGISSTVYIGYVRENVSLSRSEVS